jgi:hypothetical protein
VCISVMRAACSTILFLIVLSVKLQCVTFFIRMKPVASSSYFLRRRSNVLISTGFLDVGHTVAQLVEALQYKPECCGFDSRGVFENFH